MQISRNFADDEFRCPDGCQGALMDKNFIARLQRARATSQFPYNITSGFRCVEHNRAVGGVEDSAHLTGHAADIKAESSVIRWHIVTALVDAGFRRIGIGKKSIHVDDAPHKETHLIWLY